MLSPAQKPNRNKHYWKKVSVDLVIVLAIFCTAYLLSSYFNLSDNFFMWARKYEESWDIDELPISLLASLAALLWISERRIYESNMLMKQNHALLQRVLEVQEIERKRISQDIHDELGQYLNAIIAQATGLVINKSNSKETHHTAQRMIETADHAYQSARLMMHSLRPVALDELGLSAAIEHLVDTWRDTQASSQNPIDFQVSISDNIDEFDEQVNIGIFRIVQEALTNVAKHANANMVTITISATKNIILLKIKDNGIGFDIKEKNSGYGLIGMAERVESIGGNLTINSNNIGTEVIATIIKATNVN
jgi:signal transduction histidine kinase